MSIRIIVFLRWVRFGLHNGGRAQRLGRLGCRALQLEHARGPSAAAREARGPSAAARQARGPSAAARQARVPSAAARQARGPSATARAC